MCPEKTGHITIIHALGALEDGHPTCSGRSASAYRITFGVTQIVHSDFHEEGVNLYCENFDLVIL